MKKRILHQMILIGILTAIAACGLCTLAFYTQMKNQVKNELKGYAQVLLMLDEEELCAESKIIKEYRITLIAEDGDVVFDSDMHESEMKNHLDRPEIQAALKDGEGESSRASETLGYDMYYYALKSENGNILRVAKESSSIWGIFFKFVPLCIILCACICVASAVLAKLLTDNLIKPIKNMTNDLQKLNTEDVYPEMVPFITTIREQHEDIMKNALMRQQFTANVTHELKTPLTAISGYAELIENNMVPPQAVASYATRIHKNANRLLSLINDIIELSELDDLEHRMNMEWFDLSEMVLKCIEGLQVNAQKRDVNLQFVGAKSCMLYADQNMIEEVVYNLCDNALRYNYQNGNVWVEVNIRSGNQVVLSVRDTGIGIPKESLPHIFERFYRVDKSRSKSTGGTGLGLAIVKHIATRHDAELEISSEPGIGTRISVIFPPQSEGI